MHGARYVEELPENVIAIFSNGDSMAIETSKYRPAPDLWERVRGDRKITL